jgi:hypothetical protein
MQLELTLERLIANGSISLPWVAPIKSIAQQSEQILTESLGGRRKPTVLLGAPRSLMNR